jgi:alkyl hydroperoxide reductase subunit AhpF
MSHYLAERIKAQSNIDVLITALEGHEGNLESVRWRNRTSGEEMAHPIRHLFLFIGADPNADWLAECGVALDKKGFVWTGRRCVFRAETRDKSVDSTAIWSAILRASTSRWTDLIGSSGRTATTRSSRRATSSETSRAD